MIRRAEECKVSYRERMREGDGTTMMTDFIKGPEELNGKGRLFSKMTLNPGCSVGFHVHEGESELYYIMKGQGLYNDGGEFVPVSAGDMTICPPGTGHGIANNGDEVLVVVALILNA